VKIEFRWFFAAVSGCYPAPDSDASVDDTNLLTLGVGG